MHRGKGGCSVMKRIIAAALVLFALYGAYSAQAVSTGPYVLEATSAQDVKFSKPANNTWYTCAKLDVPAGKWRISYRVVAYSSRPKKDTGTVSAITTLSTQQGAVTDRDLLSMSRIGGNSYRLMETESAEKVLTLSEPTTFYLQISESEGNGWDSLQCLGEAWSPTVITAEEVS